MPGDEKFTLHDIESAVDDLETIPYFPREARASVVTQLRRMCPHKRALRWVSETAAAHCKQWPGMSDIRGLLCSRFDAADGIDESNCSIPGFTAADNEARYLERHERLKRISGKPMGSDSLELVKQFGEAKRIGGSHA